MKSNITKMHGQQHIKIIWPVVLYHHGTESITVKEEHWLRVFENKMLRKIFGPKMDEL